VLCCPLDKTPLRRDAALGEWVNDNLGVAYKEENGVPILIPRFARMLDTGALQRCVFWPPTLQGQR
jgi:uncharacterized protein YbaR (Trm112 family)